jgi:ATP-dependent protease HslVU (ClpYQ) peptidase subunit
LTVIVGLEHDGAFTIGADRFVGSSTWRDSMDRPKFVRRGQLVIGGAGSFRPTQIAEMIPLARARQRKNEDDLDYLLRAVVQPIREAHAIDENLDTSWSFLLGYRGHIYTMMSGYGLFRSTRGFASIGAGDDFANAAMLANAHLPPRKRVLATLEQTAQLCTVVAGPFDVVTVPTRR